MDMEISDRILRLIDERIVQLRRDITQLIGKGIGDVMACGADEGCCSKEGCCEKQGCCERTHLGEQEEPWNEFLELSAKLGISAEVLMERIRKLDPRLLKAGT